MLYHDKSSNVTICHEMSPCLIEILVRTWHGGIWQHVMTYHDVVKLINSERYCPIVSTPQSGLILHVNRATKTP